MKEYLFSYSTLQKDDVQLKLFGRLLNGDRDRLSGYKLVPIEIRDESFLSKGEQKDQLTLAPSGNRNENAEGMVYEITEAELLHADRYEPDNYKRIKVTLQSGKEAWVYIAAR